MNNQIIEKYLSIVVSNLNWKDKKLPANMKFELTGVFESETNFYYTIDSYADLNNPTDKIILNEIMDCDKDGNIDTSDFLYLIKDIFSPNVTQGGVINISVHDITGSKKKEMRKMKLKMLFSKSQL